MSDSLSELDKFKFLLLAVITSEQDVYISCTSPDEARKLRRRLYSLREGLTALEKPTADAVAFSCVGRRIRCSIKPGINWPEHISIGAPTDDTQGEGAPAPSTGLNNSQ